MTRPGYGWAHRGVARHRSARWPRAAGPASSAPTARANPPCSRCWPVCCRAERARSLCSAVPCTTGRPASAPGSWPGWARTKAAADDLTVLDVAMLGRLPHQAWLRRPVGRPGRGGAALRQTQAWDWRERPLGQLSGGERQRVLLARALAVNAAVLLMDEPLANLDPPHQADWLLLVRSLVAQGSTVVSVLHELSMALHADEMVVHGGWPPSAPRRLRRPGHPPRAGGGVRSPRCHPAGGRSMGGHAAPARP